jgi:hypothetical protein
MKTNERVLLERLIEERLISMLTAAGFERAALSVGGGPEISNAFPFGSMRRYRDGRDLELIDIQMDKDGAAKFVLNFGIAPPTGIDLPWKHIEQRDALASDLPEYYRLMPHRSSLRWFSISRFSWMALEARAQKTIDRIIELFGEVEEWFRSGEIGRHVRRVGFPINSRNE